MQVGQRVKVINRSSEHHGEAGEVTSKWSDSLWYVKLQHNPNPQLFDHDELQILPVATVTTVVDSPVAAESSPAPPLSAPPLSADYATATDNMRVDTPIHPEPASVPTESVESTETPASIASQSADPDSCGIQITTVEAAGPLEAGEFVLGTDNLSVTLSDPKRGDSWEIESPPGRAGCVLCGDQSELPLPLRGGFTYVIEQTDTGLLVYTY